MLSVDIAEAVGISPDALPGDGGSLVPASELVALCAADTGLYDRTFFPQTFRQRSPRFHTDMSDLLENPSKRLCGVKVFRGGAKTTKLRSFVSKRIAYGISRTILFVSASQGHSEKSLQWLKAQIETNAKWTGVYGLSKGRKWTDELIEVFHSSLGCYVTVIALGITGQVRGINIQDYRPDLIVVDDPCDEENTATPESRKKLEERFFGALAQSLAPASECPDAKQVLLQTPLHPDDLISKAERDPAFSVLSFGILDEDNKSIWEDRFPTSEVLKEREEYAGRNQLPTWMREKMCTIVAVETADFRTEWLQYYDYLPEHLMVTMGIDPVPPPSDRELAMGLSKKDNEVLAVVGRKGPNYFLLDYVMSKGHTPEWTLTKFFELGDKWRPLRTRVEGVAYQRTLKWILEQEMLKRKRFLQVNAVTDARKKRNRILQSFSGIASQRRFFVSKRHVEFLSQFGAYPNVPHDDLLDAVAMALDELQGIPVDLSEEGQVGSGELEPLKEWRTAP